MLGFGLALSQWANIASIIGAMMDVINTGRDTYDFFLKQRQKSKTTEKIAERLQISFSTYSEEEIGALEKRINNCRVLFIREGSGQQRKECLCSVLRNIKDGNNGFPDAEWSVMYDHLGCD
jgi:hypothetical protein